MKRVYLPQEAYGFDWDEHNILKNWEKHHVSYWECEEAFFNKPFIINKDIEHSTNEIRYQALGVTDSERELFINFTMRDDVIRPVSFRDMTQNERRDYALHKKK